MLDFDEKRFDLDEYEQRLQRFEDYLHKREDEQRSHQQQAASPDKHIKDATEDEETKGHNQGRMQHRTLTRQKSGGEGKAEFSELGEIFKQYCDKFRPLDKNSKVHVGLTFSLNLIAQESQGSYLEVEAATL